MPAYKGHRVRDAVAWLLASQGSRLLRYISLGGMRQELACAVEPDVYFWMEGSPGRLAGNFTDCELRMRNALATRQNPEPRIHQLGTHWLGIQDSLEGWMITPSLVLGSQPAQNGLLTGLGGSLWLRALWMLPISVCELE